MAEINCSGGHHDISGTTLDTTAIWGVSSASYGASSSYQAPRVNIDVPGGPALAVDGAFVLDGVNVNAFIASVKSRLLILTPDFEKHEKYPALKDAYDRYKMLEALLGETAGNTDKG